MRRRFPWIASLVLAIALLLGGCGAGTNSEIASITRDSERITPRQVLHRAQSQLDEPVRRTVGTPREWRDFLDQALGDLGGELDATTDFSSSFIAIGAMGRRPTGGFNVSISEAYIRHDSMFVLVQHTIPGRNCIVPQAQTSPITAVSLPRAANEIRFVVEERTLTCD